MPGFEKRMVDEWENCLKFEDYKNLTKLEKRLKFLKSKFKPTCRVFCGGQKN